MRFYETTYPYVELEHRGIQYGVCRDFDHISRYRGLRQVTHNPVDNDRFIALETPNSFTSSVSVKYYTVPAHEENRLDVIAFKFLGSAQYSWVLAYFNDIEDGFTVHEGQRLRIPESITALFDNGELLAPINPIQLNLGEE